MNGYTLLRNWYNYKFEHPAEVRAIHSDFYCYLVDKWNRLGQKEEFGLPTEVSMECLGIGSYNTYKKVLEDLVDFGFVEIRKKAANQYQAKVIALSKSDKAVDKPLDRANLNALSKSDEALDESTDEPCDKATDEPTDTIIEQVNNRTNKQKNNSKSVFSFRQSLIDYGFEEELVDDWLKVRKKTGGTNTKTALKMFIGQVEQLEVDINELMAQIVYKGWRGFQANWVDKLDLPSLKRNKKDIPEKYQKDIDAALPYCDDWGISKEVKLWVSPDRDEPFVTLGGLSVWYFRSYASEYASDLEYYTDKKLLAEVWERKIEEGLRETRGDTNKMTEI